MEHKIVNGLHCIINAKGLVSVFTEIEYENYLDSLSWWAKVKINFNLKSI